MRLTGIRFSQKMRIACGVLCFWIAAPPLPAQTCVLDLPGRPTLSSADRLSRVCDQLNAEIRARIANTGEHPLVLVGDYIKQFFYYVAGPPKVLDIVARDAIQAGASLWEKTRTDEQIGPTGPASGTTNLVARGSVPTLVGMALESGALTQTVSGSTATFRANGGGLLDTLIGRDSAEILLTPSKFFSLRRLSLAATFDLSRGGSTDVPVSGNAATDTATPPSGGGNTTPSAAAVTIPTSTRQLSNFVARYEVSKNKRDLASSEFAANWRAALKSNQDPFQKAQSELFESVKAVFGAGATDPAEVIDWRKRFAAALQGTQPDGIPELARLYLNELVGIYNKLSPDFNQKVMASTQAYARYYAAYTNVVQSLNEKPLFALEYTYSRPVDQPDLHNIRLICGWNPKGGQALVSFNAAGTLYGSLVPNATKYGRVRDFQAALQVDRPLPMGSKESGTPVLSVAAYYQYQIADAVLQAPSGTVIAGTNIELPKEASVLLTPRGNMIIAQAKITIRMKDTGVKIPIGVTWSNRTELIKANDVRGHIGLTYDFDSLLHR